jgi:hypothetical protein
VYELTLRILVAYHVKPDREERSLSLHSLPLEILLHLHSITSLQREERQPLDLSSLPIEILYRVLHFLIA